MEPDTTTKVTPAVRFDERATGGGKRIGLAHLDAPRKLNALSMPMLEALLERLEAWERDPAIAAVVLDAEGEKAFCAGGDVRSLYDAAVNGPAETAERLAWDFFEVEYRLDYLIHSYAKPILGWGHGLVMGGGMGLLQGCSHRVVTEASRLSMPEIAIGLFPDVGASWFLARVPGRLGLLLALTAAPVDSSDALFLGLADHRVASASRADAIDRIAALVLTGDRRLDDVAVASILSSLSIEAAPGPAQRLFDVVREACGQPSLPQVMAALHRAAETTGDPWLVHAVERMDRACPSTLWLGWAMQKRCGHRSLIEVFGIECLLASQRVLQPSFLEGVRAVLVDKDGKPDWNETLGDTLPEWIDGFFDSLPPVQELPLHDFGAERLDRRFKSWA